MLLLEFIMAVSQGSSVPPSLARQVGHVSAQFFFPNFIIRTFGVSCKLTIQFVRDALCKLGN